MSTAFVLYFRYFTLLVECKNPKACTILLRGASKDILMEVERNLNDAMQVARNVMVDAMLVPGGGAVEMAVAQVHAFGYINLQISCVLMYIRWLGISNWNSALTFTSLFQHLNEKAKSITGVHQWPYKAVAKALEVIPRTLIQNCGANTIRTITALRVNVEI